MSRATLLIVEDEVIVAADLANKLRLLDYEVSGFAASGEEAIALARDRRPDLVLMDIRLAGGMDGITAAETIRRDCGLPVIYLTAHSDQETLQRASVTEPFGYILKPFEERELASHIEMALYRHQTEKELRAGQEQLWRFNAELEQRVQARTAALEATVEALEQLLGTLASALRDPNRALQEDAARLLAGPAAALDPAARRCVERMAETARRNDGVITGLLAYGRLARAQLPTEALDTGAVLRAVLAGLDEPIRTTGAVLHLGAEWPRVTANRPALEQVLAQVLGNALKFVAPGHEPEVAVTAESHDARVRLRIRDQGIGIQADDLERVFTPLPRLHPPDRYPGLGLGLALARRAVERMNGRVWAVSRPGQGSELIVELPAAPAPTLQQHD